MIGKLGIKFLGRAACMWYMTEEDDVHFARAAYLAERVHAQDPEVILQACIFEMITKNIETVRIPDYVQEAFGLKPQDRCFRLADTLFEKEPADFVHDREDSSKSGGIPDLNRLESRMWFYYRATCYIDCGYEALHMGQVHLYTANDRGFKKTAELFGMIRAYAAKHARRHLVLMDAHTHGIDINGKLLLDYNAMPYHWTEINNPNGYFEVPFRRILSDAAVPMKRADNGQMDIQHDYQMNLSSKDCPMGFGDEDVVEKLWKRGHELRKIAANPQHLIRFGAEHEVDPETGIKLPELVVAYGGFQPYVGVAYNDSNSSVTRLYYTGDNTYSLSVVIPFAGTYDFGISTYGTLSACYCTDRFARSGSGNKGRFTVEKDNSVVCFSYRFIDNQVKTEIISWDEEKQQYVIC